MAPTYIDSAFGRIDVEEREAQGMSASIQVLNPAIKATDENDNPIILLVVALTENGREFWAIDTDGKPSVRRLVDVQLDWRYDFKSEKWVDSSGTDLETGE